MPVGERPNVELEPTAHPLAIAQQKGITRAELRALVGKLMHPDPTA